MEETKKRKKKKLKKGPIFLGMFLIVAVVAIIFLMKQDFFQDLDKAYYLASAGTEVITYSETGEESVTLPRGSKVVYHSSKNKKLDSGEELFAFTFKDKTYYLKNYDIFVKEENESVLEKTVYVRTPQNLYEKLDSSHLLTLVDKGTNLTVIGFDKLNSDGTVNSYYVENNGTKGYIYGKYVTLDEESAKANYEPDKYYTVHQNRGNKYGGGDAGHLDYFPVTKPKFENNPLPEKVYALYLNNGKDILARVDEYISFAKETNINAFVVDIKDNKAPGYQSEVLKKYSMTNYEHAFNDFESYKKAITKIKEAGFYVIGRITTFKDEYYVDDHKDQAITSTSTGNPLSHNGTYWPSAYQRDVWEYTVELAKEAVTEMGFNEIQFDYVRFPDGTGRLESQGLIDYKNTYNEEKAQAIQRFLQYATDELHKLNVYVSADVFGESAHTYVTAYGQYWAAISNVVDVISAMPYPDHFNKYEYGFDTPVWTIPYDLLNYWGENYAMKRQTECPTPAIARTWIATYDTIKEPYVTYGAKEVEEQIKGLFDAGLTGGYMTWNSSSNLVKYKSQKNAYSKEY